LATATADGLFDLRTQVKAKIASMFSRIVVSVAGAGKSKTAALDLYFRDGSFCVGFTINSAGDNITQPQRKTA